MRGSGGVVASLCRRLKNLQVEAAAAAMEGGGKALQGYHQHHDTKLLKSFTRVEPRKFGLGLIAGFLLVTCAYFSTAKFDAIHIAMMSSPSENGAAISSSGLDLGVQDAASKESSKDEAFVKGDEKISSLGGSNSGPQPEGKKDEVVAKEDAGVPSVPNLPQSPAMEVTRDEVLVRDDDGTTVPPMAYEQSTNTTQELGVLEDEELQVQDAAPKNSTLAVAPSDPAPIPVPVQQFPPPEAKKSDPKPAREWKPLCDITSNRRIDLCVLDGDVRVAGANATVTLVAPPDADGRTFRAETWRIKPYPRKADANAMRFVRELTVQSLGADAAAPACTDHHDLPALVFSDRGYTGNYFHAYTDVILPLFLTAKQYDGEVLFLVTDFQMWWLGKFLPVFKSLSKYDMIDLDHDPRVHCFRHVQVGLTSHADFSIDPWRAPNGYSMVDFTRFMRATYGLPRDAATGIGAPPFRKPRLLVVSRARTRRFVNLDDIVRGATKVGFEVAVSEGDHEVAPFAEVTNTCDAILGVHGAGLTNMVFLPTRGVVIQVVPLGGLEFVASYFRGPSRDMGLHYLEYRITPEESTLLDQYPRDHPVFTDPEGVKSKGWVALKEAYLDKQDVRLDMARFRPVLKKALRHLRDNH